MENVQKGVFITTSDFTEGAVKYVEKSQKSITLINGDRLTELMVAYKVGICIVQTFDTYRIDLDYFSE
ncbi:MAG: restriction endonuclease [Clostridium sp.]|nr:restriction endonuclease [Clostridium sp.]